MVKNAYNNNILKTIMVQWVNAGIYLQYVLLSEEKMG